MDWESIEGSYEDRPRLKSRQAGKRGEFWCNTCDCGVVGEHGKCPSCGAIQGSKIRYNKGNTGFSQFT